MRTQQTQTEVFAIRFTGVSGEPWHAYCNTSVCSAHVDDITELSLTNMYSSFETARDALAKYLRDEHVDFYCPNDIEFDIAKGHCAYMAEIVSRWQSIDANTTVFAGTSDAWLFDIVSIPLASVENGIGTRDAWAVMHSILRANGVETPCVWVDVPTSVLTDHVTVVIDGETNKPAYWVTHNTNYSYMHDTAQVIAVLRGETDTDEADKADARAFEALNHVETAILAIYGGSSVRVEYTGQTDTTYIEFSALGIKIYIDPETDNFEISSDDKAIETDFCYGVNEVIINLAQRTAVQALKTAIGNAGYGMHIAFYDSAQVFNICDSITVTTVCDDDDTRAINYLVDMGDMPTQAFENIADILAIVKTEVAKTFATQVDHIGLVIDALKIAGFSAEYIDTGLVDTEHVLIRGEYRVYFDGAYGCDNPEYVCNAEHSANATANTVSEVIELTRKYFAPVDPRSKALFMVAPITKTGR